MYGSQPNVGPTQPQAQQVPMPMSQHQPNYNYSVNSDGSKCESLCTQLIKFTNIMDNWIILYIDFKDLFSFKF